MTTKDMDLDCYGINLETADNEAFKRMITDELKSKIDTLQRYDGDDFFGNPMKGDKGPFVMYDDLVNLLNVGGKK